MNGTDDGAREGMRPADDHDRQAIPLEALGPLRALALAGRR